MAFSSISTAFRRRIHSYNTPETYDKSSKPLDSKYQKARVDQRSSLTNLLAFKRKDKDDDFENSTSFFKSKGSLDSNAFKQAKTTSGPISSQSSLDDKEPLQPSKPQLEDNSKRGIFGLFRTKNSKKPKPRRVRLKDLSSTQLIDSISQQDPKSAPLHTTNVARMLADDDALLGDLIHIVFVQESKLVSKQSSDSSLSDSLLSEELPSPPTGLKKDERKAAKEPRARFQRAWVIATLILHGSSDLMKRIANHPPHIRAFASVFDAPPTILDPILAFHTSDILKGLIHSYPKQIADALRGSKIISRLAEHLPSQAAEDLLPRFVATKMFTSITPQPLIPSHKRSITMIGTSKIQEQLARRFVRTSKKLLSSKLGTESTKHAILTINSITRTMAEISVRAMGLPRKREDSDERNDVGYGGYLGLIPAHMYNDAKDEMDLLKSPQPLKTVLDTSFGEAKHNDDILLSGISVISHVLKGLREWQNASLRTLRKVVDGFKPTVVGDMLKDLTDDLIQILERDAPVVGRARLDIIDLINEACAVCEEESLLQLLTTKNYAIIRQLIALTTRFQKNDILHGLFGHILRNLFEQDEKVTNELLVNTSTIEFINTMKTKPAYHGALAALSKCQLSVKGLYLLNGDRREIINQLKEFYWSEVSENEGMGLMKEPKLTHVKSNPNISFDWTDLDNDTVHEDYGQELYLRRLVQEASIDFGSDPSSDNLNIEHSIGAITQGLQEGLAHLFHHDDDDDEHE